MKKQINIILFIILCLFMTSCGGKNAKFAGIDLTPWLEEREGTDVFLIADTGGAFAVDRIPGPYDAIPFLQKITVGEKMDYTYEDIEALEAVNGDSMLALEDINDKPNLTVFTFYDDFKIMRVNEKGRPVFYSVTGTEELKEYFIKQNQYISPERYSRMKQLINNHIADCGEIKNIRDESSVVFPAGSCISSDFHVTVYGLKEYPSYDISTKITDGEKEVRASIRVLVDEEGNITINSFWVYPLWL